ncbi:MAG TPA: ABC transporter ATP-binding protein, partial [Anaerolineales bacterium]
IQTITPGLEDVFVATLESQVNGSEITYENGAGSQPLADARTIIDQAAPAAISVAGLTKTFGAGASAFTAVNGISFDVREGEIYGFLGPNGSGKTTTIRMLCGLLPATSGTGYVSGHDILREQERIKPDIGYMSQKFSLYKDLTVEENLNFYAGVYSLPARSLKIRKDWAVKMSGLVGRERTPVRALSGGWKQRLALSCSILHEPRVLFLDEPTSGVDPISRRAFWDLIYELAGHGVTVFITTHYMDEAEHCHELGLIYNGRIIAHGSPTELRANMHAGEMLEVACPEPLRSVTTIRKLDGILGTGLFGDRVHVLVEDARRQSPDIEAALAFEGHPPVSVRPIPFSLEDLFVIFIEMEEKGKKP